MARKKRRRRHIRARRERLKHDPMTDTTRQKLWAIVRSVRLGTELGKQNLVEDQILTWLEDQGAPSALIDYYLGYSKRAEKLAEAFSSLQYDALLEELRREAAYRGLDLSLLETCISQGLFVRACIADASYYGRAVKGSEVYPEAGGAFCSVDPSIALIDPEITPSTIIEGLYFVLYRARIFAEDLNNLITSLLWILEHTPPTWGPYYPMVLQAIEVNLPELYGRIPRPWRVLTRTWTSRDLITAEDWNDLLDIVDLLRLYWSPDFPPYPKRNDAGDPLKHDEYNGAQKIIEHILAIIGGPYPPYRLRPPIIPYYPTLPPGPPSWVLVFTELWSFGGMANPGKVFLEDWGYSPPPAYSLIFTELWSS
jgi:hypothetical protein